MDIIEITLVGFKYHCNDAYIESVTPGTRFLLKRDVSNAHDDMAVGVYDDVTGRLVAYVSKREAHKLWTFVSTPMWCIVTNDFGTYKKAIVEWKEKTNYFDDKTVAPYDNYDLSPYTKDSLKALTDTTRDLMKFIDELYRRREMREMYERLVHIDDDDDDHLDMPTMLKFVLAYDCGVIYDKLGHRLGKSKPEDLGYVLISLFLTDTDYQVDYKFGWRNLVDTFSIMALKTKKSAEEVMYYKAPPSEYLFWHQAFLTVNMDDSIWAKRYMVLMYRFASLVAKVDGTITDQEANWLTKMMQVTEDDKAETKDDVEEDVTEDTVEEDLNASALDDDDIEELTKEKTMNNALEELASLVGLKDVKSEISRLRSFIQIQNRRSAEGLAAIPVSRHFVFTGNPGTGKTTVARILAEIYRELGVVKGGQLIETDRSGLIAEYVGQTAVKTNRVIDSALDGVLFIDEAYSLAQGGKEDYGSEAIATLLKRMEDNRDRLVVILAGYNDEMQQFIDSNPGLQSRFNRYINFPDYDADELFEIFEMLLKKNDFVMTDDAEEVTKAKFKEAFANKSKNFGNARYVRNVFERTLENQAVRLAILPQITYDDLVTIEKEDVVAL